MEEHLRTAREYFFTKRVKKQRIPISNENIIVLPEITEKKKRVVKNVSEVKKPKIKRTRNPETERVRQLNYYNSNKEYRCAKSKEYRDTHIEHCSEVKRLYYEKHKEHIRAYQQQRRDAQRLRKLYDL